MDEYLRDSISIEKDVEGLCHTYRHNLYHNKRYLDAPDNNIKCILPCTPLAVVKVLEHTKVYAIAGTSNSNTSTTHLANNMPLAGKKIVIINRSDIVGRPLAAMLANDGTIYVFLFFLTMP